MSAGVVVVDLADGPVEVPAERSARTLLKTETMSVTRITLAAGAEIAEHRARGAITVHVLAGDVRFSAGGDDHELGPGRLLYLEPGVPHRVSSRGGGSFLLTVAFTSRQGDP